MKTIIEDGNDKTGFHGEGIHPTEGELDALYDMKPDTKPSINSSRLRLKNKKRCASIWILQEMDYLCTYYF